MRLQTEQERSMGLEVDRVMVAVLSTTAGAVDVIGFLSLGGLFTAHITGNLVVLAAHYVTGGFSQIGPLLSVPVFVAVLGIVTALFSGKVTRATRRTLLILQAVLLAGCLGFGVECGPFSNPNSAMAVCVGMLGVAAMAVQNALVKLELHGFPSTAVMTTNTVQLTIDLAVLLRGQGDPEDLARARRRARLTFPAVGGFIAGCAAGGLLEVRFGLWGLVLPVVLAATAVLLGEVWLASPEGVR
jgi:uncharacterized membrane protein YoaK (UPF0700 family)